jgi:hypothetical protein
MTSLESQTAEKYKSEMLLECLCMNVWVVCENSYRSSVHFGQAIEQVVYLKLKFRSKSEESQIFKNKKKKAKSVVKIKDLRGAVTFHFLLKDLLRNKRIFFFFAK